jgi:hypothetical protein
MTAVPIAFQSNQGRYRFEGTTELVNAYAEQRGKDAKAPLSVLPADGIIELVDEAPGPGRGLIYMEDLDKLYAVHPSSIYRVTNAAGVFTATRIGTIPGIDHVQLSRNQKADPQLIVRSDAGVQVVESDSVAFVTDDDLPDDVVTAEYVSGYHAYGEENRKFTLSALNSAKVIDSIDFATFEQKAGKLIRIVESNGEMVGFCSKWMEFWRNIADEDFPFVPMGFKNKGLMSADAVVSIDNTLIFPGDDGIIYRLNNYDPARISNHHVERMIQDDADHAGILGFGWSRGGHAFANFTGTDWSRSYDAATQSWHSRQSYGRTTWRARHAVQAWGKTIVQDAISGKLGYLDSDTYTEYGGTMVWQVISPPMHAFPNGLRIDAFHMDLATGYGTLSGQGSSPKVMLEVSRDGGNTFGGYRELELGATGKHAVRVTARRLGMVGPKGVVFRISISDPVVRALVGTDIETTILKR